MRAAAVALVGSMAISGNSTPAILLIWGFSGSRSISRQIVEAHKGRIWAENRYGKAPQGGERPILGARFIVRIPAIPQGWVANEDDDA